MSRVALLIATTDYIDSGLRRLRSPASDARRLGALLEDKSIGYFDRVIPLINESKAEIEEHIERVLRDLSPSDTLLIYVSCHGIRDKHGRLFFTTLRTKRDLPESTAISARFIEEQMSRCRARRKVLLLDCCFGGTYIQGMAPFAPDDGELSAQAAGKGTYVMTASDVLEFAFEGETVKSRSGAFHSVFTEAVIDGLSTGRADIDNDGVITAHELFQHIERHVRESGAPQTPTEFRSGVQGNIPIAKAALWHRGPGAENDPFVGDSLPLGELLPALATSPERGLCAPDWPPNGQLRVPLGRMYDPAQGLQETLTLDLSGGAPHIGVVGSRWSGKTSVLRTLACSLALTHTPDEVQIYGLHGEPDGMMRLDALPHVGMVADYAGGDDVRVLVDGIMATLKRRERLCDALRIRSPKVFRQKRMRGALEGESNGEVFLLIDSWPDFAARYPDESRLLLRVAQQGVYYGIHLVVSADRWTDLPQDLFLHLGTWIELALADPRESRIDSDLAGGIPPGQPGFGLTRGRRYVRLAVPTLARTGSPAKTATPPEASFGDEGEELDALLSKVAAAWQRPGAQPLSTFKDSDDSVPRLLDLLPLPEKWVSAPSATWFPRLASRPPVPAPPVPGLPAPASPAPTFPASAPPAPKPTTSAPPTPRFPTPAPPVPGPPVPASPAPRFPAPAPPAPETTTPAASAQRLTTPVGVDINGAPVILDIKEASLGGWGPHGLCVGATGSGKSELLRTLVLGLAVTHSSETLNFVLVDFKGGATFAEMTRLPHVAAVITNLADELSLADRMVDAIRGEVIRRQELLRDSGNYANLLDYDRARAAGAPLVPLPTLVLVIDEFAELLAAEPGFLDVLILIGRIGRSLGIHLLLASQRLETERLRGLETYLSYRICLRTFSAEESRAVLGVPDAYHLPSVPGAGYLRFDMDHMVGFRAAYASGWVGPDARAADGDSPMDVILNRLENQGPSAHQIWLPPLDQAPTLDELLPGLTALEGRGLTQLGNSDTARLVVPLGLVDKPLEQRREILTHDFSGAAGNLLIIGGSQSGKSSLLRTLVASFALTHTPQEVQFYALDFGGGTLSTVAELPHVGGIASRLDPERVRRTVAEVSAILTQREEYFRANGIDSMATYRRRRALGEVTDQPWGDVFLVIDGWRSFLQDYEMMEKTITDIALRGLGYGIHVVLTTNRIADVRPVLKDLLHRLELRLSDPRESEFSATVAANIPANVPGRGQTPEKLHFIAAVPRIDGILPEGEPPDATAAMSRAVAQAWQGPAAPPVRLLPRELPVGQLPKGNAHPQYGIAFGIEENTLQPVFVDFETDPFFLVLGESESGKTSLLRLLVKQICERYTPDEARIVVADYRRSLLGSVPDSHLAQYATMPNALDTQVAELRDLFERRTPPPDVTPQQLRDRSWWSGPRAFVIVDDYDLVATSSGNPLAVLTEHLPFARDLGFCFVIARNSAGASRAAYELFMQRIKELGAQGVVLSGNSAEGEILGNVRARPLPPGRGYFVSRRRGTPLIQVGWQPEH
ncbi:type VII secretion protein EccCb [Streptomyces triticisoli]|uniref:type VII secretion protein EccCb n=1 Tax=Streptomyces triticisoli TaxID=2182797 RepID=UPI000DD5480F|nr:type VII secretion protein EccCb [Streptomyces triticisoli]